MNSGEIYRDAKRRGIYLVQLDKSKKVTFLYIKTIDT